MKILKNIYSYFTNIICAIFGIKISNIGAPTPIMQLDPMREEYMIPFNNSQFAANSFTLNENSNIQTVQANNGGQNKTRKSVKPIDIVGELERIPTNFSLDGIEDKIAILKEKEKLITQYYAKRETSVIIECLTNRKRYNEFRDFFSRFDATTGEKIDILLKEYELKFDSSDLFVPEFPDIAIKIMKEYTENIKKLMKGKKPLFYVIATPKDFQQKTERRDPILLAQSPFGFYYYILGAWDKEMILLSEL